MKSNGDGTFHASATYSAGVGPRAVVVGDFTGDGHPDLAIAKSFATTLTILQNNGDGTFAAPADTEIGMVPTDLAVADFNSDGRLDLAAIDYFNDRTCVLPGNGDGTFETGNSRATGSGPASIAAADINGDGHPDLLTANYSAGTISLLLGSETGALLPATSLPAGSGATFVAAADLDSDGALDILTANANADTLTLYWGSGEGAFYPADTLDAPMLPRSIAVGNFDSVGGLDLAIASQGAASVTVVIGGLVIAPDPVADGGGPYAVAEGSSVSLDGSASSGASISFAWDLDGDGIFGETGLSAAQGNETGPSPTFLASGLDGDGTFDVKLRVTDINAVSATTTITLSILNAVPSIDLGGAGSSAEGATYTMGLSTSDPGDDSVSQWIINWGDGQTQTIVGNPSSANHVFADDGQYTISAAVVDEDGTFTVASPKILIVTNIAPSLALDGPQTVPLNGTYTLTLGWSDPGDDALSEWIIDWGDGSTQTLAGDTRSVTKVFRAAGARTIAATAADEDGSYDLSSKLVSVIALPPGDTIGNSAAASKNIGEFKAGSIKAISEYVGPADRNDYLKFDIRSMMVMDAKLSELADNADLMLLNAAGARLAYVKHAENTSERIVQALQPGTYYLRVLSAGSDTPYRLRIQTSAPGAPPTDLSRATDLGKFANGKIKSLNGDVSQKESYDLFKFTLTSRDGISLKLAGLLQNADLLLLDSRGRVIKSSARSGTADDSLAASVVAGTYYAKVAFAGSGSTPYRLRLAA